MFIFVHYSAFTSNFTGKSLCDDNHVTDKNSNGKMSPVNNRNFSNVPVPQPLMHQRYIYNLKSARSYINSKMSYELPQSISQSETWKKRLANVKKMANDAEDRSTFFLEVSSRLIVSLFVVALPKKAHKQEQRDVHLHFLQQPSEYPPHVKNKTELEAKGYGKYLFNKTKKREVSVSKEQYKK
jgi:hypothetical protein